MPSKFLNLSTDTTLGGATPSDELAVSQKAIKTYVDNHGGGGGSVNWGDIGGDLSDQADLQNVLSNKVDKGHQVVEFQEPTASNNYTWYRKYADGWVEQGGRTQTSSSGETLLTLPVEMQDTDYTTSISVTQLANAFVFSRPRSATAIGIRGVAASTQQVTAINVSWFVYGMAAS